VALTQRGLQHERGERLHQTGVLGQPHELVGPTTPCRGWCQRKSASTALTSRVRMSTIGW